MKLSVTITGGRELAAKLRRLEAAVAGDHLAKATLAGALVVEGAAKEKVHVITGTLRRSIHSAVIESSPTKASAIIGTDVEYAPYEEYGTRYRGPHPYLRPALDEKQGEARQAIGQALKALIEREVT